MTINGTRPLILGVVVLLITGIYPARANHDPGQDHSSPQTIPPDWKHLGITWRVSGPYDDREEVDTYLDPRTAISSDGRYVVFSSNAWNLVPGDQKEDGHQDVFLYDNQTGTTERISVSSAGVAGNSDSYYGVDVSSDGRLVVFASGASNLVSGDTNGKWDVFVRDRQAGTTTRVSISSTGAQATGDSWLPRISDDGHIVVYTSGAPNLVEGDTNNKWDIFAYDMLTGQTERVSVSSAEVQGNGESGNNKTPAVSSDGRTVAFSSEATNLAPDDTNTFCDMDENGTFTENCTDVFVRDRVDGVTERVSVNGSGQEGNSYSMVPAISGDGRYVAFFSWANNLVPDDMNTCQSMYYDPGPCPDIFVRDRQTGMVERANVSSSGAQSTLDPGSVNWLPPAISGDGRYVAFASADIALAPGFPSHDSQVLIHDRITGETSLVSVNTRGDTANYQSYPPADLSGTGRYVSFSSRAWNLGNDGNSSDDIYVRDREGYTYALAGTVRDAASTPIQGVTVAGTGLRWGAHMLTDPEGGYQFAYMPPGEYSIKASAPGLLFKPSEHLVTLSSTTLGVDFVSIEPADFRFLPLVMRG
jgi:Tol biopolymer transport system component